VTPTFEKLQQLLKQLPGLGYRSAERLALHLLVEQPDRLGPLVEALREAAECVRPCPTCGNLCEADQCAICADARRDHSVVCIVENATEVAAMERAGGYQGLYHVLHGKLSPMRGIGPEQLNLQSLRDRLDRSGFREIVLALSNDIEGEATCHYLCEEVLTGDALTVSRIGFGLPSGSAIVYADATTLRSAFEGRRGLPRDPRSPGEPGSAME